jgi:hypothetical protein
MNSHRRFMPTRFDRFAVAAGLAAALLFSVYAAPARAQLPPVQQQGSVEFVSGGVGLSESDAMKAAQQTYPLSLVFAQHMAGQNAYAADVPVTITDAKGVAVLTTTTNGPYLLVKLPPGLYKISSTFNGTEQIHQTMVKGPGSAHVVFEWK